MVRPPTLFGLLAIALAVVVLLSLLVAFFSGREKRRAPAEAPLAIPAAPEPPAKTPAKAPAAKTPAAAARGTIADAKAPPAAARGTIADATRNAIALGRQPAFNAEQAVQALAGIQAAHDIRTEMFQAARNALMQQRMFDHIFDDDPAAGLLVGGDWVEDGALPHILMVLGAANYGGGAHFGGGDGTFRTNLPTRDTLVAQRTDMQIAQRREAARELNGGGLPLGGAARTYLDLATRETSDTQNTHDRGVLAGLRGIITRLRADQGGAELPTLSSVHDGLAAVAARGHAPERLNEALVAASATEIPTLIQSLGATDAECLQRTWLRASDPRNGKSADQIREAIYDALRDSWEDSPWGGRRLVCANGRVARILASLVLLDWDTRNWDIKKLEQFRNDVFDRTRGLIEAAAAAAVREGGESASVGRLYSASDADALAAASAQASPAAIESFAAKLRGDISAMVDAYAAELSAGGLTAFSPADVDALKREAVAAV